MEARTARDGWEGGFAEVLKAEACWEREAERVVDSAEGRGVVLAVVEGTVGATWVVVD